MLAKILLIEDKKVVMQAFRFQLSEREGFQTDWAQTLREAIEFLRRSEYDSILLDLGLDDSQGTITIETLIDRTDRPIVVYTGDTSEVTRESAIQKGAYAIFNKRDHGVDDIALALVEAAMYGKPLKLAVAKARVRERSNKLESSNNSTGNIVSVMAAVVVIMIFSAMVIADYVFHQHPEQWLILVETTAVGVILHHVFKATK